MKSSPPGPCGRRESGTPTPSLSKVKRAYTGILLGKRRTTGTSWMDNCRLQGSRNEGVRVQWTDAPGPTMYETRPRRKSGNGCFLWECHDQRAWSTFHRAIAKVTRSRCLQVGGIGAAW